jgi:dodecin
LQKSQKLKYLHQNSFEDAMQEEINRVNKTLRNVKSAWVKDFEVEVDDKGQIAQYRVLLKITFVVEKLNN